MFDGLCQWFSAHSHNSTAQAAVWTPTSSKGVLSVCFCESYKVKERMCLMIPVGQLRPGTNGHSECVSGNCLPRHHVLYCRPVSTKMLFVIDIIFKKKKKEPMSNGLLWLVSRVGTLWQWRKSAELFSLQSIIVVDWKSSQMLHRSAGLFLCGSSNKTGTVFNSRATVYSSYLFFPDRWLCLIDLWLCVCETSIAIKSVSLWGI